MSRNRKTVFVVALLILSCVRSAPAQIAKGATKYLGNTTSLGNIPTDFGDDWNQISPETEGKWPSIEGQRETMVWTGAERVSNFARDKGIPWTMGPMLGSGSYPSWMAALSPDSLKAEIREWFDLAGARFPDVATVIVVSEVLPGHSSPGIFGNALGGAGTSGYDWMIQAFQMARTAFPDARLILEDYNNIEYATDNANFLKAVRALFAAQAPLGGIGIQAHEAFRRPLDTLSKYLDSLASTGLPLFITQYDIDAGSDTKQDSIMQAQFPLFWNHPRIAGITYWGIVLGKTWRSGTGLKTQAGADRPALSWLRSYVAAHPNPPSPLVSTTGIFASRSSIAPRREGLSIRESGGRLVVGVSLGGEFRSLASVLARSSGFPRESGNRVPRRMEPD